MKKRWERWSGTGESKKKKKKKATEAAKQQAAKQSLQKAKQQRVNTIRQRHGMFGGRNRGGMLGPRPNMGGQQPFLMNQMEMLANMMNMSGGFGGGGMMNPMSQMNPMNQMNQMNPMGGGGSGMMPSRGGRMMQGGGGMMQGGEGMMQSNRQSSMISPLRNRSGLMSQNNMSQDMFDLEKSIDDKRHLRQLQEQQFQHLKKLQQQQERGGSLFTLCTCTWFMVQSKL